MGELMQMSSQVADANFTHIDDRQLFVTILVCEASAGAAVAKSVNTDN